jgi:diaminopimelate decarboxylase
VNYVDEPEVGSPSVYPATQSPVRGEWLASLLDAWSPWGMTVSEELRSGGLRLHMEPGRALLDGCGLTVARVESRTQGSDGTWLIRLAMNHTQCRSAADFLVDPILLPTGDRSRATGPIEGYVVGANCIESELLTGRRLSFPRGVAVGDLVVFVNTAAYRMHILESAAHQIPLAKNLIPDGQDGWQLDPIDA